MNQKVIDELVAAGRITRVPVNQAGSRTLLVQAARHLESAGAIAATDPSLAYVALYDAARKSVLAHMLAHGYREVVRPGAHQAVKGAALAGSARSSYLRGWVMPFSEVWDSAVEVHSSISLEHSRQSRRSSASASVRSQIAGRALRSEIDSSQIGVTRPKWYVVVDVSRTRTSAFCGRTLATFSSFAGSAFAPKDC